ncbi:type III polyketide synthase [Cohnella terricola]|uniref:Type III polyketide synthase n=1 Tax=Cohnella terricola TaxID=1289167 RepID=A0A559JQN2_9BACL|nr:type III polyketide synthase [Cohnella terricola]TVY02191.1 type III polyketide synthase [Cohnella terricola]
MEHVAIVGIGTAVPAYGLDQEDASRRLSDALASSPDNARWAQRIFGHSGVDRRYTCDPRLLEPAASCCYLPSGADTGVPTTEERMAIYQREAVVLAAEAARKALADSKSRPGDITHLIAVSCTGMFLPGLDAELIDPLDLRPDVRRIPLTFMGCAAGLTAIRQAEEIVRNSPSSKVLVVAVELCTLHIQPSFEREQLFAAAFFGDGASACVIGKPDPADEGNFGLRKTQALLLPNTSDKMRWTIGNYGFRLFLSPEIPRLIAREVPEALQLFWGCEEMPELWAIHPGGRGIIDALSAAFGLEDSQTEASRSVLRRYGNMSSATILFVLAEIRERQLEKNEGMKEGIAVAFGPGMTAEMIRFTFHP